MILARGLLAAFRQLPHLGGNHSEALAMFARSGRFDRSIESQQVRLPRDLFDDGDLVRDLLDRRNRLGYALAALLRVLRALVAILSVCSALSAFCLMLETISSIEEDASSAAAACELAPLETCTDAVEIDWLAAATSLAI